MQTFTAVLPTRRLLPHDLALLLAPVRAEAPSAPDAYVGRADGVLLDDGGHVVAFIVRLARELDAKSPRTLVPATAVTVTEGPILRLSWTADQLRAEPWLDADLQPHNRTDGGPPVESRWMPARPGVVPPGPGVNGAEAVKEGFEGGIIGAALGTLAGLALGGPIAAASLAVFFAAGGSLAGVLSGASQETAPEASEMKFPPPEAEDYGSRGVGLGALEQRLRDLGLAAGGLVTMTRLTPMTTPTEAPPELHREAIGWR
jgi:hypothetical protein